MTSAPRSPPDGWASTRSTTPWCSRRASTSAWTTCSGCSTTPATPTSTRREQQDELTSLVEPADGEPFVLHPGRVRAGLHAGVLHAARRSGRPAGGQVLAGPARPAHPLDGRLHRPRLHRAHHAGTVQRRQPADHAVAGHEDRPAVPAAADQSRRTPLRQRGGRVEVPGPARTDAVAVLPELHPTSS